MADQDNTAFSRALAEVAGFSETSVAVMPEQAGAEMLRYVAHVTGEDVDKLARIYALFITTGRLDGFSGTVFSGASGFAEE